MNFTEEALYRSIWEGLCETVFALKSDWRAPFTVVTNEVSLKIVLDTITFFTACVEGDGIEIHPSWNTTEEYEIRCIGYRKMQGEC